MKCEHGKRVYVVIESGHPDYWDYGYKEYDQDGHPVPIGSIISVAHPVFFVKVQGCPLCTLIQVSGDSDQ